MNGEDKELSQSFDVGFTMDSAADIAEKQARAQAEFEEQQLNDLEDEERWSAGRDASTSQEFWSALDSTDPISFYLAGGAAATEATSPASFRAAERAEDAAGESLEKAYKSAEASRRGASGALTRRNRDLARVGVEFPTNYPDANLQSSKDFFDSLGYKNPRTQYFKETMKGGALARRPPGTKIPRKLGNVYWAMQKVLEEGVPKIVGEYRQEASSARSAALLETNIAKQVDNFIKLKTGERATWTREAAQRRALVANAQADLAAHKANRGFKVAKRVGSKALKTAGVVGGAAGAAFMPTFMAMKQMANQGKLDATLAYMSYDLKNGPLDTNDLSESTYNELVGDMNMSDNLYEAGILSTDLHRDILRTAIREHLIEQTEIGQEGPAERFLEPFRMGD